MQADYVIVGAGSAGCVLANRLTEDPSVRVILIEAGGRDWNPLIHIPVGFMKLLDHKTLTWGYTAEADPGTAGRAIPYPRGRVLGGSSSINAMCYIRGHARDYDVWRQLGNAGWSWDDVLPYFKSIERYPRAGEAAHGQDGELSVQENRIRWEIVEAWRQAAFDYGMPPTDDHNSGDNDGVGYFQGTIRNGRRHSAAQAFLKPIMHRSNLRVLTDVHVRQIRFDGKRATGVELWRGDELTGADANAEVILCAGAIGSPQILQLSGVGPTALLSQHGIPIRHDLPGVGENMQDHWQIRLTYKVKDTVTLNQWIASPLRRYAMGAYYTVTRRGPMGVQPPQLCAFTRSDPSQETPNLQYHVSPATSDRFGGPLHAWPGLGCGIAVVRPQSIGWCRIKSADPRAHPAILHNFLETPGAQRVAIDAVWLTRRIMSGKALAPFAPEEHLPAAKVQSDEEILAYARQTVITVFHQSGTCKMGQDPMAVVDERLRVRGLAGLRVVDASIMPNVVSGNTNAPTMMIAEKASDMIRKDRRAAPIKAVA
ncbi:MAG TPA: GMC family oxidoreductase N-terminal domain-containing protein [Stellaceae bacterium]|nr:GMC family oxidoreductase N-terminal domain-containing protein [Stellaceae bacterium]